MRYRELIETPIGDFEVHNMDEPGSFHDVDRKMLNNPVHVQNVRKKFENVPFDFHLYFVNRPNVEYLTTYEFENDPSESYFNKQWGEDYDKYNGLSDTETVKNLLGVTIQPDPDAITVVFTSNANPEDKISMTPWIIAHRFGHALGESIKKLPESMNRNIDALLNVIRPLESNKSNFTFRSARIGKLNYGEAFPELIAQYCTSRITLNIQAKPELIHIQRRINALIDHIMDDCVGQIFIAL